MISELVAASAWIIPPGWLSSFLSLSPPSSPALPRPPLPDAPLPYDDEDVPPSPPDGNGGVPAVPVEKLPLEDEPFWLKLFASFDDADEPVSLPPLPSMPRSVFASFTASA